MCRPPLVLLTFVLLSATAVGQTIDVPKQVATIQEAVDQATPGTEIRIKGGTYVETVIIDSKTDIKLKGKGKVVIRPFFGSGVTVSNSSGIVLETLRVEQPSSHGFHVVDSTDVMILKSMVSDAGEDSIRTDGGSGITIDRCKVEGGRDAIALSSEGKTQTSDSLVSRNKIRNPLGDGVIVNGDGNLIERNFAFETADDGFQMDFGGGGTGNVFEKNRCVRAASDGLLSFDTGNTFQDNVVMFPADSGIFAVGTGHLFENNRIVKPQVDGMLVQGDGCTFRKNKVMRPLQDGIDIESDGGLYDGNVVRKAGDDGFEVSGIGNTIQGNSARGSGGFDLFDFTGPGDNTYSDNTFKVAFP